MLKGCSLPDLQAFSLYECSYRVPDCLLVPSLTHLSLDTSALDLILLISALHNMRSLINLDLRLIQWVGEDIEDQSAAPITIELPGWITYLFRFTPTVSKISVDTLGCSRGLILRQRP